MITTLRGCIAARNRSRSFPGKFAEGFLMNSVRFDVRFQGSAQCAVQDGREVNKQTLHGISPFYDSPAFFPEQQCM